MKRTAAVGLGILFCTIFIVVSFGKTKSHLISPVVDVASSSSVLSFTITATESASPSATPTSTPSPIKTLTPTQKITPTPTPTPVPVSSKEVNGFIDRFAGQYGVDPNVVRYVALCESGFNSSAVQGKYVGLFQFDTTTWKNIRKEMGEETNPDLRFSAEEAVQTFAYAFSKGKSRLWPNCIP